MEVALQPGAAVPRAPVDAQRLEQALSTLVQKELTEAMGGTVAVRSAVGDGSCVTIRRPQVAAGGAATGYQRVPTAGSAHGMGRCSRGRVHRDHGGLIGES